MNTHERSSEDENQSIEQEFQYYCRKCLLYVEIKEGSYTKCSNCMNMRSSLSLFCLLCRNSIGRGKNAHKETSKHIEKNRNYIKLSEDEKHRKLMKRCAKIQSYIDELGKTIKNKKRGDKRHKRKMQDMHRSEKSPRFRNIEIDVSGDTDNYDENVEMSTAVPAMLLLQDSTRAEDEVAKVTSLTSQSSNVNIQTNDFFLRLRFRLLHISLAEGIDVEAFTRFKTFIDANLPEIVVIQGLNREPSALRLSTKYTIYQENEQHVVGTPTVCIMFRNDRFKRYKYHSQILEEYKPMVRFHQPIVSTMLIGLLLCPLLEDKEATPSFWMFATGSPSSDKPMKDDMNIYINETIRDVTKGKLEHLCVLSFDSIVKSSAMNTLSINIDQSTILYTVDISKK